jgi:hypothetical protein
MSEVNSLVPDAVLLADSEAAFIDTERIEVGKILPHALGDFGGALSWPVPLSVDQQKEVLNAVRIYIASLEDRWKPGQGLLEHLNLAQPLASETLLDPARALEALIASPRGQALGLAVQTHLKGISTDASVNEYALAALQLNLDPLSIENPQRNSVAGFDLADKQHWGKPVSSVFKKLREHLIKELFSNPEMAGLGAHLLLARNAPMYLIKDIPDGVKYGGPAWFNLAVATEMIEAQSPGKVANLSFAQVMICAESAALVDPAVTRHAQTITLIDWGVIHGLVERESDESYTEVQLSELKTRFNDELADRLNTPILLSSVFPSRMGIARAGLEKQFGKNYPIEKHVLEWEGEVEANLLTILSPLPSATVGPVGMHTLLDVAMMDGAYKWKTSDPLLKYRIYEINELDLRVRTTFNSQFETTLNNLKEGARLTFQHLVSELPLEDRENLEYGKIDFYQNKTFRLSTGFYGRSVIFTSPRLTLRVERGIEKKVSVYCIDLTAGSISKKESDPATETDQVDRQVPSIVYATTPFYLADQKLSRKLRQRTFPAWAVPVPVSYSSARTRILADAFVEHLDYDSEDILSAAEGQTTYDKQVAVLNSRVDFLLNLIPFKSAISNFIDGKYLDGAIDLFLDVLGFVTAGVSAAAKLAQLGARTASALSKALKAAKIIGALVIGELNPLSGLHVLATGGARLVGNGVKFLANRGLENLVRLRGGAAGTYELLEAVSKQHATALPGIWKVGELRIDGIGVLKNDQWYPYNLASNRVYGPPGDFQSRQVRMGSLFGADANYADRYSSFHDNIKAACTPNNVSAFKDGFNDGLDIVKAIPDYSSRMNTRELLELATKPGWLPEEMGALTREIKESLFLDAVIYQKRLLEDMPKGVKVVPFSQCNFLARVDVASNGRCAALSYGMAYAFHHRREGTFFRNVTKAADNQSAPQAAQFIADLEKSQQRLGAKYSFHTGGKPQKMDAQNIIDELVDARDEKILMIGTKSHGMVAGTRFKAGKQEWFFYDPNSGVVLFDTQKTLQEGLSKALGDGALAKTFQPYGKKRGGADYAVNEFKPDETEINDIRSTLENFSSAPLSV